MISRPDAFGSLNPFIHEGPLTRTVEDAALALDVLSGYDPRDPFSLDEEIDFVPAVRRSIRGWRIAYSPDYDVFPVDPREEVVGRAVMAFEEAGAHVEEVSLGVGRDQRELSDLWCRIIMPLDLETFDVMKAGGHDLLGRAPRRLPVRVPALGGRGRARPGALDVMRDQQMRTEVYDVIQGVLDQRAAGLAHARRPPVENADDGNTKGPAEIEGVGGRPPDRLVPHVLPSTSPGHPAASDAAGPGRRSTARRGCTIVGRRYADGDVLAASAAFERLRPWHDSYRLCRERAI